MAPKDVFSISKLVKDDVSHESISTFGEQSHAPSHDHHHSMTEANTNVINTTAIATEDQVGLSQTPENILKPTQSVTEGQENLIQTPGITAKPSEIDINKPEKFSETPESMVMTSLEGRQSPESLAAALGNAADVSTNMGAIPEIRAQTPLDLAISAPKTLVDEEDPAKVESIARTKARAASPSSEFARKRQMFESSNTDKKNAPPAIQRKPLRSIKQTSSESSPREGPTTTVTLQKASNEGLAVDPRVPKDIDQGLVQANFILGKVQESMQTPVETAQQEPIQALVGGREASTHPSDVTVNRGIQLERPQNEEIQAITEGFDALAQPETVTQTTENLIEMSRPNGTQTSHDEANDIQAENKLDHLHSEGPISSASLHKDPYADLDPWGRASLNRFAAMLREEARAESNKDKLNIFNVFTARESRLRVVLYG